MIASDRLLRWLCWGLIVFSVVAAAMLLTLSQNPFGTPVPDSMDYVERLRIYRSDDQKIYGLVQISGLASAIVLLIATMLGPVLRRFARAGAGADVMAVLFIVGGAIGVTANLVNIAAAQFASFGLCDCGYTANEAIGQAYALGALWTVIPWLNVGSIVIVGLGVALAGAIVDLGRDFRLLSNLIALGVLAGAVMLVLDQGFLYNVVIGLTAGIAVPTWAFFLARGSRQLTERA